MKITTIPRIEQNPRNSSGKLGIIFTSVFSNTQSEPPPNGVTLHLLEEHHPLNISIP